MLLETLQLRAAGPPVGTNLWKTSHRSACWAVPYHFSSLADLYLSQVGATDNTLEEIWNVCVLKGGCLGVCGRGRRQEGGKQ